MTAEEKAKELVERFKPLADWNNEYGSAEARTNHLKAKQCALICVDEILNISYFTHEPTEDDELYRNYWIHVKTAIEKL